MPVSNVPKQNPTVGEHGVDGCQHNLAVVTLATEIPSVVKELAATQEQEARAVAFQHL